MESPSRAFHYGRWGNADLLCYEHGGTHWIVKDFSPCPFLVRTTYGKFMIRREIRALKRLQGLQGIPQHAFRLDDFALCYRFIPGKTLKEVRRERISPDFFVALEHLVHDMHAYNIVHLDIRYMRNILITDQGAPALLDFQSSLFLDNIPGCFHQLLKDVDISGVYKCWQKINPASIDQKRLQLLADIEKKRALWVFKGYPLGTRFSRR